ncbi:hypothetical protein R3P38DRAFT_2541933 [Favolaschia claudopus]|uniref:Uncharacterized protein n=1 Tax=Favolaschia claudopus TaxID=2862362 RepID=A0AAW0ASZ8_9AGAR
MRASSGRSSKGSTTTPIYIAKLSLHIALKLSPSESAFAGGQVDLIGFVSWMNDHYSATCKVLSNPYEFGDWLNRCDAPDLLPILRWAFSGLNRFAPPLQQQSIQSGLMDVQGTYSGGGSCGIAATNFVEL